MVIEIAGYAPNSAFGIYKSGSTADADKYQVFAGSAASGATNNPILIPIGWSSFGFYIKNTNAGFTWYSDSALNAGGGLDHFVAFQGTAGATIGLLGFGLIGVHFLRRRFAAAK